MIRALLFVERVVGSESRSFPFDELRIRMTMSDGMGSMIYGCAGGGVIAGGV
jgi:hypothetical protein